MTAPVGAPPTSLASRICFSASRHPLCLSQGLEPGIRESQGAGIAVIVDGVAAWLRQPFTATEVLRHGVIPGAGMVVRIDRGRASLFAPDRPVAFDAAAARPVFRTFRGSPGRLHVDGLRWDWGAPAISVAEVRAIRGIGAEAAVRIVGDDAALPDATLIDVTGATPPRLRFGDARPGRREAPPWA